MVDTTSPLLGLLLQGTGGDNNSWGQNLNDQVITLIENAIAGVVTIAVTGGSHSLSAVEARSATIVLTGVLASDQTIVVPNLSKKWSIVNNCTGAFYTFLKTAAGTAINLPAGTSTDVTCYGADTVQRADASKVGEFFYFAGTTAPAGSLECDGSTPLCAGPIDLFARVGTTWGVGNGTTTFTLPDGKTTGRFMRSRTASVTIGTYQSNQNKAHTHTGSGTTSTESASWTHSFSGTTSTESATHTHSYSQGTAGSQKPNGTGTQPFDNTSTGATTGTQSANHTHTYSGTTSTQSANHTHTYSFTTSSDGGAEARPEAMVGLLCIRY